MDKWQATIWNNFSYESLEETETGKGIRLRIRTEKGLLTINLPKDRKHVMVHRNEKQVDIREWLAKRVGLI